MPISFEELPEAIIVKMEEENLLEQIIDKLKEDPDLLSAILARHFLQNHNISSVSISLSALQKLSQGEINALSSMRIDAIEKRIEEQDGLNQLSKDVGTIFSDFLISTITSLILGGELDKLLSLVKR